MSRWRAQYLDFRVWLGLLLFEQPPPRKDAMNWTRPYVVNIGFGQIIKMNSSANEIVAMWMVESYGTCRFPYLKSMASGCDGERTGTRAMRPSTVWS